MTLSASRTEQELINKTHEHWDSNDISKYIRELLPREMEYAGEETEPCDTLALLIGFSPDPLLQTIWKYRPQRIVLILNYTYGDMAGKFQAADHVSWICQMVDQGICLPLAVPGKGDIAVSTGEATPDWIFRELRDRLLSDQRAGKRVVVDITGAKKNMAAGAFLFAAYAGADISYVDFEKYHPKKRRPYGYSCRIGLQTNPYMALGLRDWERVRELYTQYAFRNAEQEVERVEQTMIGYFSLEQRQAVSRLRRVLTALEEWDNGDFTASWRMWEEIVDGQANLKDQVSGINMPQVVMVLGSLEWPSARSATPGEFLDRHWKLKRGDTTPEQSIFNQPHQFLAYAQDELDKIGRLIEKNNDYRSAFLRSAGLDELLLKARVAVLWLTGALLVAGLPRDQLPDEKRWFDAVTSHSSADAMRDFLLNVNTRQPDQPAKLGLVDWSTGKGLQKNLTFGKSTSPHMTDYWSTTGGASLTHERMVDLRGEAIHTHLSIPEPIARQAWCIAARALQDFEEHWVSLLQRESFTYQPWHVSWEELCTACGVDFLPALKQPTKEQSDDPLSCGG